MTSTSTPSATSSFSQARCRVSPPPRIIARQRTSIVTRMPARLTARHPGAGAPTAPGRQAPRCVWRDRDCRVRVAAAVRRHLSPASSLAAVYAESKRISRAQLINPSWNQRRSGTPKPRLGRSRTPAGTHGSITFRNRRLVVCASPCRLAGCAAAISIRW